MLRDVFTNEQDRWVNTCLVSLDQEQAFDKTHTYMMDALS